MTKRKYLLLILSFVLIILILGLGYLYSKDFDGPQGRDVFALNPKYNMLIQGEMGDELVLTVDDELSDPFIEDLLEEIPSLKNLAENIDNEESGYGSWVVTFDKKTGEYDLVDQEKKVYEFRQLEFRGDLYWIYRVNNEFYLSGYKFVNEQKVDLLIDDVELVMQNISHLSSSSEEVFVSFGWAELYPLGIAKINLNDHTEPRIITYTEETFAQALDFDEERGIGIENLGLLESPDGRGVGLSFNFSAYEAGPNEFMIDMQTYSRNLYVVNKETLDIQKQVVELRYQNDYSKNCYLEVERCFAFNLDTKELLVINTADWSVESVQTGLDATKEDLERTARLIDGHFDELLTWNSESGELSVWNVGNKELLYTLPN